MITKQYTVCLFTDLHFQAMVGHDKPQKNHSRHRDESLQRRRIERRLQQKGVASEETKLFGWQLVRLVCNYTQLKPGLLRNRVFMSVFCFIKKYLNIKYVLTKPAVHA